MLCGAAAAGTSIVGMLETVIIAVQGVAGAFGVVMFFRADAVSGIVGMILVAGAAACVVGMADRGGNLSRRNGAGISVPAVANVYVFA